MKISLFKTAKDRAPSTTLSLAEFIKRIKKGEWEPWIQKIRNTKDETLQKKIKNGLPAVTLAGVCSGRTIQKSSGYIGIDIDAQDNGKDLFDKTEALRQDPYVHALWRSSRGNGLWAVFKINHKKHVESFLGIAEYMFRKFSIVVDEQCKDNGRLCYVSYDPEAYLKQGKKVFKKLGKATAIPGPDASSTEVIDFNEVKILTQQIVDARKDVTHNYQDWLRIGLIYAELGSKGRDLFHKASQFYSGYDEAATNLQFDKCLKTVAIDSRVKGSKRASIKTLTYLMIKAGIMPKIVKYNKPGPKPEEKVNYVTIYPDQMQEEGNRIYTYGLLEFKVVGKGEFKCTGCSTARVAEWLYKHGVRSHGKEFYIIEDNVVREIFSSTIYNITFKEILKIPKGTDFRFDSDSDYITRDTAMAAAQSNVKRIVDAIPLGTFDPENRLKFLKDTKEKIFLKFEDTLACITAKGVTLVPYKEAPGLVWHKSIRPYKYLIANGKSDVDRILGRAIGNTKEVREAYMTAIGYMLSTYFPPSGVPMLFCSDVDLDGDLNNGGNGKDFMKQILSQFREVVTIPGKSLDLKKEFALHMGNKDTEVFWFEDLNRATKMESFYNYSNGVTVRRLHTQAFTVQAKIGVSLQHTIDMEGNSNKRRQIFLLFQKYFSQLEHGIATEFGQVFGEEWKLKNRAQFNNFIFECCKLYLKKGIKRMDTRELSEARKEDLGDEMYSQLKMNTPYTTRAAMNMVGGTMDIGDMSQKYFYSNWKKWCDHMDLDLVTTKNQGVRSHTMMRKVKLRLSKKRDDT